MSKTRELSFDILICSEEAYSSIENIIEADNYELYILGAKPKQEASKSAKEAWKTKLILFGFLFALGCGLVYLIMEMID